MEQVYDNVLALAGKTPLIRLHMLEADQQLEAALYAKLEFLNPTRSAQDRTAGALMEQAAAKGALKPGSTVVAPVTGNLGIALSQWTAVQGCQLIAVLPGPVGQETRKLMGGFGTQVVITPPEAGFPGAVERAKVLAEEQNAFYLDQQAGAEGWMAHYRTTGPELWTSLGDTPDLLVATVETGNTLRGTGQFLKEQNPAVQLAAAVLEGAPRIVPELADLTLPISRVLAGEAASLLARREGILAGLSSGAALAAAIDLAKRPDYRGGRIAVLLTETGERYLSTGAYGAFLTPPDPF